jgi:hypothetical protein
MARGVNLKHWRAFERAMPPGLDGVCAVELLAVAVAGRCGPVRAEGVERLRQRGFVTSSASRGPDDVLTPKGLAAVRELAPLFVAGLYQCCFENVEDEEKEDA